MEMCKNLKKCDSFSFVFHSHSTSIGAMGKCCIFVCFFLQFCKRRFIILRFKNWHCNIFLRRNCSQCRLFDFNSGSSFFGTNPMKMRKRESERSSQRGSKRLKTVWKWFLTFIGDEISEYTYYYVLYYMHIVASKFWTLYKTASETIDVDGKFEEVKW